MTLDEAKGLCYMALAQPIGLVLRTNDRTRARARLYAARRAIAPAGDGLQFREAPASLPDGDLLIVKRQIRTRSEPEALSSSGLF